MSSGGDYYGPFKSYDRAQEWAELHNDHIGDDWCVTELCTPWDNLDDTE